jgi:4-hydroxy-tetrahydrodipicolinate synthase
MFKGAWVALVTPFKQNAVDTLAIRQLVDWHIAQGTQGLVVCGCTGEGLCLTPQEQQTAIKTAFDAAKKRIPIIASTSFFTPDVTLMLAHQAEEIGVDGLMVLTPPAVKPTQEALFEYFKYINDHVKSLIIVYDNPPRTGTPIKDQTVAQFARLPHIVGLKDSSGDANRCAELIPQLPQDFTVLSGDDFTTGGFYAYGGHGAISVTGNFAPHLMAEYWQCWQQGKLDRFVELGYLLAPLHKAAFCENSPAPSKYALSLLGLCSSEVRSPLQSITSSGAQQVETAMMQAGLLKTQKSAHG